MAFSENFPGQNVAGYALQSLFWGAALAAAAPVLGQKMDTTAFHEAATLPVAARFATADQLGQAYVITAQNAIEKYAPNGQPLARYTQNRLGSATWLDASNPLKIMVLYADFRTAIFLDRNLTELGALNWEAAGHPFARRVAMASDGNLWLYDEADFRLKKIAAATGETLAESQPLHLLLETPPQQPAALLEAENRVFLSDTAQGIFVFDAYAQFSKLLKINGVEQFSVSAGRAFFVRDGTLCMESLVGFRSEKISLPLPARAYFFAASRLFCLRDDAVKIFRR